MGVDSAKAQRLYPLPNPPLGAWLLPLKRLYNHGLPLRVQGGGNVEADANFVLTECHEGQAGGNFNFIFLCGMPASMNSLPCSTKSNL